MDHIHSTNTQYKNYTIKEQTQKGCEESPVVCCLFVGSVSSVCDGLHGKVCVHAFHIHVSSKHLFQPLIPNLREKSV